MVVHWAGEKSNVIVALARDSVGATDPKSSSVSVWLCRKRTCHHSFMSLCLCVSLSFPPLSLCVPECLDISCEYSSVAWNPHSLQVYHPVYDLFKSIMARQWNCERTGPSPIHHRSSRSHSSLSHSSLSPCPVEAKLYLHYVPFLNFIIFFFYEVDKKPGSLAQLRNHYLLVSRSRGDKCCYLTVYSLF